MEKTPLTVTFLVQLSGCSAGVDHKPQAVATLLVSRWWSPWFGWWGKETEGDFQISLNTKN